MAIPEALQIPLARLEAVTPLDPNNVEHTTSPDVIRALLPVMARPLRHISTTEKATDDYVPHLLTIHSDSELHARSLPIWHSHEGPHAVIADGELAALGLEAGDEPTGKIPATYHVLGLLTRHSESLGRAIAITSTATAAINETSTQRVYAAQYKKYLELDPQSGYAVTLKEIMKQEATHAGFYDASLRHLMSESAPWERWLGRKLLQFSWQPVGAKKKSRRPDVGAIAVEMMGEDLAEELVQGVQSKAEKLLMEGDGLLPPFVTKRFRQAIDMYKAEREAA